MTAIGVFLFVALLPASFVSYDRGAGPLVVRLLTKLAVILADPLKLRKSLPYHHIEVATCIVARKRSLTRDCLFECSDGTLITVISRSGIDQNA
jgi:hypothetical protein